MKVSEMFPRKYLSGEDLTGETVATIKGVTVEQMRPAAGSRPEAKYVLYFTDLAKALILSRTTAEQIAELFGDDTAGWTGKRVTLYPVPMTVAQRQVVAVRVKAAKLVPASFPASEAGTYAGMGTAGSPNAAPTTGEIPGPAARPYGDGREVDPGNAAEAQAFDAYVVANRARPATRAALRQWVKDTPKGPASQAGQG